MTQKALKLALDALEARCGTNADERGPDGAITALREALAQPDPVECDIGVLCIGCTPRNSDGSCPSQKPNGACNCYEKGFHDGSNEFKELYAAQPEQEPVAFPNRRAVEREIERIQNPKGMHLNDGKERVILPGGTLRYLLALADRATSPKRPWVELTDEKIAEVAERMEASDPTDGFWREFARAIEAAHNIGVNT